MNDECRVIVQLIKHGTYALSFHLLVDVDVEKTSFAVEKHAFDDVKRIIL